jgi:hypothetical protein
VSQPGFSVHLRHTTNTLPMDFRRGVMDTARAACSVTLGEETEVELVLV